MTVVACRAALRLWLTSALTVVLAALVLAAPASGAAGDEIWVKTWKPPGAGIADRPFVKVAPSGRIVVAGRAVRAGRTDSDLFVACYTSAGARKWVKYWDSPGHKNDLPAAVAVDDGGNVIVFGSVQGTGKSDWVVVKVSAAGRVLWARTGGAAGDDMPTGLAVDGKRNIYTTTSAFGALSGVWCETVKHSPSGRRSWTVRHENMYGAFGKACVWYGSALYVAAQDSLGQDPGVTTVIKYGATGVQKWIRWWVDADHVEQVWDIAASRYGVVVAGTTKDGRGTVARFTHGGRLTMGVAWEASAGAGVSTKTCGISDAGDCFVGGGVIYAPAAQLEFSVMRFVSAADRLAVIRAAGQAGTAAEARDVVVTGGGKVYATGYRTNVPGGRAMLTVGWTGAPPWSATWAPGLGTDAEGRSIALSASAVYVAGTSEDGQVVLARYAR